MDLNSLSWGTIQSHAFQNLQDTLKNAVELSYPDSKKEICVFTDASERFLSAIMTQCERKELEKGLWNRNTILWLFQVQPSKRGS